MDDRDAGHASEVEKATSELFGHGRTQQPSQRGSKVARGTFTQYPESLRLQHHEESEPIPPLDFDKAIANAKAQDEDTWQAWATTVVEGKVQQQVDARKLSPDSVACGTYRAKVFDYLMRRSTWFAKTFDQNMSKHIEVKKVEFHAQILTTVLEGFSVPASTYGHLEGVLRKISDGIVKAKTNDSQQYWIMITKYNWQPITQSTQTGRSPKYMAHLIRVIQLQVSLQAREYTVAKSKYESVSFYLQYNQYQADFNAEIFANIRPQIDQKQIETGIELAQARTTVVSIPP
ncbi:hypothetical protein PG997_010988 [Apiospora hydei]|uniref:Uncharacterized protein n=1 Tax=Apiospora hydei TaxID=1337664 RepID=A0ABR1VHV9_9PEZI